MTRRVIMSEAALEAAPLDVRAEAQKRFDEIALGVERIPQDNPFWRSADISRLCLMVRGWSFFYTIDPRTLRVTDVRRG